MRNLKKVLSVLVVVAMIAMTMVPAFAAETYTYDAQAKALNAVGLFNGVSTTEYAPDLGSALTREQGFALIVRLLGKADDAAAMKAADVDAALATFGDAKDVEPTLKNTVALAVKNGLVIGNDSKKLDSKGAMIGNDFATVLLRQLGYEVTADGYNTAAATLAEKGGLTAAEATKFATKNLIRDDAVGMMYAALKATYKTGATVIATLIADKDVDQAKAEAAGIVAKVTAATSMTAKGTGRETITVTFNGSVDTTKAKLAVKRGATAITVTTKFAADNKSATLVGASKFSEGEYTITAAGVAEKDLTATVTYEDERIEKIEFTSDKAVIVPTSNDLYENRMVYVYFKLLNQYSEDVTESYSTYSGDIDWSTSYDEPDEQYAKYGKLIVTCDSDDDFTYGQSVPVSVVYNDDVHVVTASTVLTVGTKAGVGSVEVTKLYNDMEKKLNLNSTYESFYLLFNLKDQYGNALNFKADKDLILEDLSVSTSNNSVVEFTDNGDREYNFQNLVIDGNDYIALPLEKPDSSAQSGTIIVTVVSKSTGKMAQYTVEVGKGTYATSFSMSKPDVAVIGEKTIIPFTAYDAEGKEVTDVDDLDTSDEDYAVDLDVSGIGVSSSEEPNYLYFEENSTTGNAQLVFNSNGLVLEEDDTVTITTITAQTYKTSSITLKMKEAKKPESIEGISSSFYKKIAQGSFAEFKYDKLTIQDSYDRTISAGELRYQLVSDLGVKANGDTTYTDGKYRIAFSSSSPNVQIVGAYGDTNSATTTTDDVYYIGSSAEKVYFYGAAEGTATITTKVQQNYGTALAPDWKDIADADYDFTMTTVDRDDIKSIAVKVSETAYDEAWYTTNPIDNSKYLKPLRDFSNKVTVDGVMADGSKVWMSQQILVDPNAILANAYTITPAYGNKITVNTDSTVAGATYNANYYQKLTVTSKVNDDEDETTNVPFAVSLNSAYYNDVDGVTSSYKVSSADPQIATLTLVYNQFAQLSADGGTVEINKTDLDALKVYAAGDYKKLITKIVADAVKAVDQYGKEHDKEYGNASDNEIYSLVYAPDSVLDDSRDSVEVTVISNSGAVTLTFTISVK